MVVSSVLRDALTVAIKLSAPMLVLCMAIGIIVAIFQAVTQIHEQTLGFVLKLVIIIAVLLIGGNWMMTTLQDYTKELFLLIGS
ncbi:MAG: flagellar biosynthetic protein FliQ [Oscillospiraceae bacterium]|nr:flagellar biosynthetic protein FliQ [Oscillospiraceae bacterium]